MEVPRTGPSRMLRLNLSFIVSGLDLVELLYCNAFFFNIKYIFCLDSSIDFFSLFHADVHFCCGFVFQQHVALRKRMDADHILEWKAPEVSFR